MPTRSYGVHPKENDEGLYPQTWIEGIGSRLSPDMNIFGKSETYPVMSKCIVGNAVLCRWWTDDLTSIHDLYSPEMVNGISSNGQWYDLSGRRLSVSSAGSVPSVLPKGVYIRDGRKVAIE